MSRDKLKTFMLLMKKDESKLSYNEISKVVNYHPKHLIRLNKLIRQGENILIHKNKEKKPVNSLSNNEVKFIIDLYKEMGHPNCISFYNKYITNNYNKIRSYNTIYKLLIKNKLIFINNLNHQEIIGNMLMMGRYNNIYFGIDYQTKQLLYFNKTYQKNIYDFIKMLDCIIKEYGIPPKVYIYGISLMKKSDKYSELRRVFNELDIEIINYKDNFIEKVIKKSLVNNTMLKKIKHNFHYKLNTNKNKINNIICLKNKRKVLFNNIVQYNNIRYRIITDKSLRGLIAILSYKNKNEMFKMEVDNYSYPFVKIKEVLSKKNYL